MAAAKYGSGGNKKLFEEHTHLFIDFWEANSAATLAEARDMLMDKFDGFMITLSGFKKHANKHCQMTLKKLEKVPAARCSDRILDLRREMVLQ